MEQFIGNCRFLGWCDDFGREIKKICDKCPYKLKHEQIWYDEEMTDGVPANEICLKYREIGSVHDTFQVAKTCRFIDHTKFGVYVKEMQAYIDSFK